jgi:excisionase family DNA binding protein
MATMLRTRGAAEHLKISQWKLLDLAKQNKIPHVRVSPRLILFNRESLDTWVESCEQAVTQAKNEPAPHLIRRLI